VAQAGIKLNYYFTKGAFVKLQNTIVFTGIDTGFGCVILVLASLYA
jgi:hypothetical protein